MISLSKGLVNAASDAELAAVLSHELGHFIADHAREKQTTVLHTVRHVMPWLPLAWLLNRLLSDPLASCLYAKLRFHEHEADYIGLLLMTDAGYDPAAAISILETFEKWQEHHFQDAKRRAGPLGASMFRKEDPRYPTVCPSTAPA